MHLVRLETEQCVPRGNKEKMPFELHNAPGDQNTEDGTYVGIVWAITELKCFASIFVTHIYR